MAREVRVYDPLLLQEPEEGVVYVKLTTAIDRGVKIIAVDPTTGSGLSSANLLSLKRDGGVVLHPSISSRIPFEFDQTELSGLWIGDKE